jgi:hypothetical protein
MNAYVGRAESTVTVRMDASMPATAVMAVRDLSTTSPAYDVVSALVRGDDVLAGDVINAVTDATTPELAQGMPKYLFHGLCALCIWAWAATA